MKINRSLSHLLLGAILLGAPSCITVNVNFPETAVQHAADDFVKDLYSAPTAETPAEAEPEPETKPKNKKPAKSPASTTPKTSLIEWFIPSAYAQSINTSSPKAREIKTRMGTRVGDILKWKSKGALGEGFEGNLAIRDEDQVPQAERARMKKTVDEENQDREELYTEIQNTNALSDHGQNRIRRYFGSAFRANAPTGSWIENEDGKWSKK